MLPFLWAISFFPKNHNGLKGSLMEQKLPNVDKKIAQSEQKIVQSGHLVDHNTHDKHL